MAKPGRYRRQGHRPAGVTFNEYMPNTIPASPATFALFRKVAKAHNFRLIKAEYLSRCGAWKDWSAQHKLIGHLRSLRSHRKVNSIWELRFTQISKTGDALPETSYMDCGLEDYAPCPPHDFTLSNGTTRLTYTFNI